MATQREKNIWRRRSLEEIHVRVTAAQAKADCVPLTELVRLKHIAAPPDDLRRPYDAYREWALALADYPHLIKRAPGTNTEDPIPLSLFD